MGMCGNSLSKYIDPLLRDSNRLVVAAGGEDQKLYDLTGYSRFHPGGEKILYEHREHPDITQVMRDNRYHRHSRAAFLILEKYRILDDCSNERRSTDIAANNEHGKRENRDNDHPQKTKYNFNWDKPIIYQLDQLGDRYFDWVHHPEEHSIRLFQSNLWESLSKAPWWIVTIIWVPITCISLFYSFKSLSQQAERLFLPFLNLDFEVKSHHLPFFFFLGTILWTLLEYIIHRWIFHLKIFRSSPVFRRIHFILHGHHHKAPMDPNRLVFPPVPASVVALAIYHRLQIIFPTSVTFALFAGILLGYVAYDLLSSSWITDILLSPETKELSYVASLCSTGKRIWNIQ